MLSCQIDFWSMYQCKSKHLGYLGYHVAVLVINYDIPNKTLSEIPKFFFETIMWHFGQEYNMIAQYSRRQILFYLEDILMSCAEPYAHLSTPVTITSFPHGHLFNLYCSTNKNTWDEKFLIMSKCIASINAGSTVAESVQFHRDMKREWRASELHQTYGQK